MEKYNQLWRAFFGIALIAIGIQQLICADFRPVIIPPAFPVWLPVRMIWTWIVSLALIAAGAAIVFQIKARAVSLVSGSILLLFVLLLHVPYQMGLYPAHLGVWTDPLKCLTLSGGAFVVAGSLPGETSTSAFMQFLEKLIPAGKYFLGATMVAFGIDHFLYTDFVATLVPGWIPGALFWTYFAGIALILAGLSIMLTIQRRLAAALLGLMIFLWLILLHIPRAITDPHSGNGNEWTSVFEALAFSGIAFLLAGRQKHKVQENKIVI